MGHLSFGPMTVPVISKNRQSLVRIASKRRCSMVGLFAMPKMLPIEVWILIVLILEVMIVNWKLISVSSRECEGASPIIKGARVWKPKQLACSELVKTSDLAKTVNQPSDYVFHHLQQQQGMNHDVVASVAIRIARGVAQRQQQHDASKMCKVSFHNATRSDGSFQWTVVSDPTQQAIESFFRQQVSRDKVEPHDETFQKAVLRQAQQERTNGNMSLENFDFVAVMERLDESLVVLRLLPNLELSDFLYAENISPFELHPTNDDTCVFQVKPYLSPGMEDFFAGNKWQDATKGDTVFYEAANRSPDLTIQSLGRERVAEQVRQYRRALRQAQLECGKRNNQALFPCTASGQRERNQSCHFESIGCGHACLDNVKVAAA